MPDEKPEKDEGAAEALTDEEKKVLAKALKKVEGELFRDVLKRLSVWIGIVLSLMTGVGIITITSWSSNVETTAASKLSSDPELRDKVVNKAEANLKDAQDKLKDVQARLDDLRSQAAEIERKNARASTDFVDDLTQIRTMLARISGELSNKLPREDKAQQKGVAKTNVPTRKE